MGVYCISEKNYILIGGWAFIRAWAFIRIFTFFFFIIFFFENIFLIQSSLIAPDKSGFMPPPFSRVGGVGGSAVST